MTNSLLGIQGLPRSVPWKLLALFPIHYSNPSTLPPLLLPLSDHFVNILTPQSQQTKVPHSSFKPWRVIRGKLGPFGVGQFRGPRDISCLKGTLKEGKNRHSVLPQTPLGFSPALYKGPQTWQLFAISWKLLNIQMPGPRARPPTSESLRGATGASAFFFFF